MFQDRGYRRHAKAAGEDLYRDIWRTPHAADCRWDVAHAANEAAPIIADWPIEQLGTTYHDVVNELVDRALAALTWWMIFTVELEVEPERGAHGAHARADAVVIVPQATRDLLTAPGGEPVSRAEAVAVVSEVLTRLPLEDDQVAALQSCEAQIAGSLQALAARTTDQI